MPWTDVVTAISTAVIAILLALPAFASFLFIRELQRAVRILERSADTLQREIVPAIQSVRGAMEQARQAAGTVRTEIEAVVDTSKDLRGRVKRAADAAEVRLSDLETLLDVVYEEVEDTALDVASALRTTRRGMGLFSAVKRAFLRRGR
jgi:methyl-accepting chemotaxis protein